jgi:hypothetical protein
MNFLLTLLLALVLVSTFAARLRSPSADECRDDIQKAAGAITKAGVDIARSVSSCNEGFTDECNEDISNVLDDLVIASSELTDSVYDCSNSTNTDCSADINDSIADLAGATTSIMNAVLDCQSTTDFQPCRNDVQSASKSIAKLGVDIAKAVEDC